MRRFVRFGSIYTILKMLQSPMEVCLLLLVKFLAEACNFTKSNTPPWLFSSFLNCANSTKLRKSLNFKFILGILKVLHAYSNYYSEQ